MRSSSDVRYDGADPGQSRGHRPKQYRVRLAVNKAVLVTVLLFGPRRRSVTALDVFRWPVPGWYGVLTPGSGEAREAGFADHDPDTGARPAGSGGASEERLIKPLGAQEARRRSPRRTRRRPGGAQPNRAAKSVPQLRR